MSTVSEWMWHRRAQDSIAQTYLTNSKRPNSHVFGVVPTHIREGRGCYVIDHQGRKYLDFICGLGTNLLGYGNERVNGAISSVLRGGYSHSLATHHEVVAAEKLKELFTFVDAVKFLKTGSEACAAAIRIARAKTGKSLILSEGYHGWTDPFVSLSPPAKGVPSQNGIGRLGPNVFEKTDLAGIIVEPIITDYSEERLDFLRRLRLHCDKIGAVLIFDEVITGFRTPLFSASAYFSVTPDIIILGKAIANGMPLAAIGGKYDVMNCGEYFVSSTYAGEVLSLVAAIETMTQLQTRCDLTQLWQQGQAFLDEFNALWPEELGITGYPSRGTLCGKDEVKALFLQETCKAGMLFGMSWFFNFPLIDEWKEAMKVISHIVGRLKRGEVKLEGEMPKTPFAQAVREKL